MTRRSSEGNVICETQCSIRLQNHSLSHSGIANFFMKTSLNPPFKGDARLCLSSLQHKTRDQSLGKVSLQDSRCIDPHTAKFSYTSIIYAAGTCPGGPGSAQIQCASCVDHMVIQQDSCSQSSIPLGITKQ